MRKGAETIRLDRIRRGGSQSLTHESQEHTWTWTCTCTSHGEGRSSYSTWRVDGSEKVGVRENWKGRDRGTARGAREVLSL